MMRAGSTEQCSATAWNTRRSTGFIGVYLNPAHMSEHSDREIL
jgi:hypothetical protein